MYLRVVCSVLMRTVYDVSTLARMAYTWHHHFYMAYVRQPTRHAPRACKDRTRRLGDIVVTARTTGHKGRGFKLGRGDGLLRVIKIRRTPSSDGK
jgi:hypothetical protein